MDNSGPRRFFFVYLLVCAIVLASEFFELQTTYYLSKPLIVLSLLVFYSIYTYSIKHNTKRNLLLGALLFSGVGDVFLMFEQVSENYFLTGLFFFLGALILYCLYFLLVLLQNRPWNLHWLQIAIATIVLVYGVEFYVINNFAFGNLKVAILFYCLTLCALGIMAAFMPYKRSFKIYITMLIGVISFIVSDSIIAIERFVTEMPYAGMYILATYMIAQYLIVSAGMKMITNVNPQIA